MAQLIKRQFVEGTPKFDVRRACRKLGRSAFAGSRVALRTPTGEQWLDLVSVARQPFGGEQIYMRCRCGARACLVYLVRGVWACRRCHSLSHWIEAAGPVQRRVLRIVRLRERIGQAPGGSIVGGLPPKPKWMRWRTYERHALDLARRQAKHFRSPLSATASVRLARMLK